MAIMALVSYAQTTPPQTATKETWQCAYQMHSNTQSGEDVETGTEAMDVAFDGNDIYFNLPNPIAGSTWIKGTRNGGKVTFTSGQKLGKYASYTIYLVGQNENGLCDVDFVYYEEQQVFVLGDMYAVFSDSKTEVSAWGYFSSLIISKDGATEEPEEPLVEIPGNVNLQEYAFTATSIEYNADGSVKGMTDVQWEVLVGFNGMSEVYVKGLFEAMPDAVVKGTMNADDVVFASGQYLGKNPLKQKCYFVSTFMSSIQDAEFTYENGVFDGGSYYIAVNSMKNQLAPYYVYAGVKLTKIAAGAATPAAPSITNYEWNAGEGLGTLDLSIPLNDVNGSPIKTSLLGYKILLQKGSEQSEFVFRKSEYQNLEANELTVIPYKFTDDFDFVPGPKIYFYAPFTDYDKVGVQSVYTGGGETRTSEIGWYLLNDQVDGIGAATRQGIVDESLVDLQGRRATTTSRGLLIKTQRMADGSVRSTKVVK